MPKRISDVFNISSDKLRQEGVFDGFIDIDSKFYIDPRLLETTNIEELQGAYSKFQSYFANIFCEIYQLRENNNSPQIILTQINDKLIFPEIPLVGLGYSSNNTAGKGIGKELATKLAHNAIQFADAGIAKPIIFEIAPLFEQNFGADRISDMTIQILLLELLKFSERVAKKLKIPVKSVLVDSNFIKYKYFDLPYYLKYYSQQPLILIPEDILTKLPVASPNYFDCNISLHNQQLRKELNKIIRERSLDNLTWKQLIKFIKQKRIKKEVFIDYPDLILNLIDLYKSKLAYPYNFEADPDNEFRWHKTARIYAQKFPLELENPGVTRIDLNTIGLKIANHFARLVKQNDLCLQLYNDTGKPKSEKLAQLIFLEIMEQYILQNNLQSIDIEYDPKSEIISLKTTYSEKMIFSLQYSTSKKIDETFNKFINITNNYRDCSKKGIFLLLVLEGYSHIMNRLDKISETERQHGKKIPEIILIDGRIIVSLNGRRKVAYSKYH